LINKIKSLGQTIESTLCPRRGRKSDEDFGHGQGVCGRGIA
jgi:hypothetical protein